MTIGSHTHRGGWHPHWCFGFPPRWSSLWWAETQKPARQGKLPSLIYSTIRNRHSHKPGACLRVESWKEKRRETKRCLAPLLQVWKTLLSVGQRRKQTASAVPQPWQHARTCTRISCGSTKTMKCGEPGSHMKHTPAIYKIRKAAASKAQSRFYQQGFN